MVLIIIGVGTGGAGGAKKYLYLLIASHRAYLGNE